jgi:hypothetical protein
MRSLQMLLLFTAMITSLAGSGCRSAIKRSPAAERFSPSNEISTPDLRVRVRAGARRLPSIIEEAADRIAEEASMPSIRRAALVWKIEAIPELQAALFQPDPGLALFDAWAFSIQMSTWFSKGSGKEAMGPSSDRALIACVSIAEALEALAVSSTSSREDVARGKERVLRWSEQHPIETSIASRKSVVETMPKLAAEPDLSFLSAVGTVADDVGDLRLRLDLYNAYLPKMVRWQAELLLQDTTARLQIDDSLRKLDALTESAEHAAKTVEGAPDFVERERKATLEALRMERVAVLEAIRKDLETSLDSLTQERVAASDDLEKAREATIEALRQERIATILDVEQMSRRLGRDASENVRSSLWWLLPAGLILVGIAAAAWIGGVLILVWRLGKIAALRS